MYQAVSWTTVSRDNLIVNGTSDHHSSTDDDYINGDIEQQDIASLEIRKPLDLLGDNLQIVITPSNQKLNMKQLYTQITESVIPVFVYIIDQETLSANDIEELTIFQSIVPKEPILFIRINQTDT